MIPLTDHGLIIRRSYTREDDVQVTVFLKNIGKVTAIARGTRRVGAKLKNLLEPFTEADFQIFLPPHGTRGRLITGLLINSNMGIRSNVSAFATACRMAEITDLLVPDRVPTLELFDILRLSFHAVNKSTHTQSIWIYFASKFLKTLGYGDIMNEYKLILDQGMMETIDGQSVPIVPENVMQKLLGKIEMRLEEILPRELKSMVLS